MKKIDRRTFLKMSATAFIAAVASRASPTPSSVEPPENNEATDIASVAKNLNSETAYNAYMRKKKFLISIGETQSSAYAESVEIIPIFDNYYPDWGERYTRTIEKYMARINGLVLNEMPRMVIGEHIVVESDFRGETIRPSGIVCAVSTNYLVMNDLPQFDIDISGAEYWVYAETS